MYILLTQKLLFGQTIFGNIKIIEEIKLSGHTVYNPFQMEIYNDHIILHDDGSEKKILHFDLNGRFINSFGKQGQGPGEFNNMPRLAGGNTSHVFISSSPQKLDIFDLNSARYIKSILIKNDFARPVRVFDNLLVARAGINTKFLMVGYTLKKGYEIDFSNPIYFGDYKEDPELIPCSKNPLLKEGSSFNDNDENIFFAFRSGSLIIGYNRNGDKIFKTTEPYNIEIPNYIRRPGTDYASPPRNKYPVITISLGGDEKYIYSLYSGAVFKTFSEFLLNKEDINQGEIINVFDKKTSKYLGSYKLPVPVRKIAINRDNIYALSIEPRITIYKLKKPLD